MKLRQSSKWDYHGNMDLSIRKIEEREQNCQMVYETILFGGKVTTDFIKKHLDSRYKMYNEQLLDYAERLYNYKQSIPNGNYIINNNQKDKNKYIKQHWKQISKRTIQRRIENDPRIIEDKRHYSVSQEARFETRNRDPKKFGFRLFEEVILRRHSRPRYNYESMKDMIIAFGTIMMFAFIEASRPFTDKVKGKGMSSRDRDDLVRYWASNAIPIESMFQIFNLVFTRRIGEIDSPKPVTNPNKVQKGSYDELTEDQVKECHKMLRHIYPDIYESLKSAREKFINEISKSEERN